MKDTSKGLVTSIGAVEILGGLGLPSLTAIAAVGLAIVMLLAAIFHTRRVENSGIIMNVVFMALAVFVAINRF